MRPCLGLNSLHFVAIGFDIGQDLLVTDNKARARELFFLPIKSPAPGLHASANMKSQKADLKDSGVACPRTAQLKTPRDTCLHELLQPRMLCESPAPLPS